MAASALPYLAARCSVVPRPAYERDLFLDLADLAAVPAMVTLANRIVPFAAVSA